MKNTERQKFEERWQEAFEGSEMTPSDSVWSNIDLKLDNEKMKRRVIYYQRLAAAAVLFALLIGVGGVRYFSTTTAEDIAIKSNTNISNPKTLSVNPKESQDKSIAENKPDAEPGNFTSDKQLPEEVLLNKEKANGVADNSEKSAIAVQSESAFSLGIDIANNTEIQKKYNNNTIMDTRRYLPLASQPFDPLASYNSPPVKDQLPDAKKEDKQEHKNETTAVASVLPEDSSNEKATEKKKKKTEDLWLAFGATAGTYNPGTAASTTQTMDFSKVNSSYVSQAPQSSRSSVGAAYSMGITVGKKIADRWIVQTGINYLNQAINYTSNFATQSSANQLEASVADYASLNSDPVSITQPYKVSSNTEFVSIPMQAGYLLIDKKVGLQLNAGVASDIFLRNTLKDQSGQSSKYSQGSGKESPYRSVNWAGLASTELSYKMSKQYRISIAPGIRYSLQPALKAESGSTANPLVLDIGFRFRYIFE